MKIKIFIRNKDTEIKIVGWSESQCYSIKKNIDEKCKKKQQWTNWGKTLIFIRLFSHADDNLDVQTKWFIGNFCTKKITYPKIGKQPTWVQQLIVDSLLQDACTRTNLSFAFYLKHCNAMVV